LIGAVLVACDIWAVQRFLPASPAGGGRGRKRENWRTHMRQVRTNHPLVGSWLITFGANVIGGVFFTFMPLLAHARGLDADQIGIVFLVQSVTNAVARIPFGALSDRIGHRKYQALAGAFLATLAIAAFARSESFLHFLLAGLFLGASLALAFIAIGALIAETTETRFRGLAMGGYNSFIYFGLMAGSIGFGPLMETAGFQDGFLLAGGINLVFLACFTWFMKGYSGGRGLKNGGTGHLGKTATDKNMQG
jgi:MFS family permease